MEKPIQLNAVKILSGFMVIILTLILVEYFYSKHRVPFGLYLNKEYIGGLPYKDLTDYFAELDAELQDEAVHFYLPQQETELTYTLQELGIGFDWDKTIHEIQKIGKPFHYQDKYTIFRVGGNIEPFFKIDGYMLSMKFKEIERLIEVSARNAEVWAAGGKLKFRPHQHGTYMDKAQLSVLLLQKITNWPDSELKLSLPIKHRQAKVTVSTFLGKGIKDTLYIATTFFNPEDENRVHNIRLASEQVNNIILGPGDVFSFNELVGEAGSDCGYKEAPVIVNNELVMGVGGGICQVSSTLYNGALMTGMTIMERHNHGLPVAYLPPGLDATVVYDYYDLKFKNELDTYVLVNTEVEQNQLHVTIFGNAAAIDKIEILTKDLTTILPPVKFQIKDGRPTWYREIIQEGKPGYTVETIRVFYQDGKEIKREGLGEDSYTPIPYIYAVGNIPSNKQ